jgi:hypothetical protein
VAFWNIPTFLPAQTIHKSAPKPQLKPLNLNDFRQRAESSILSGSTSFSLEWTRGKEQSSCQPGFGATNASNFTGSRFLSF